MRGGFGNAQATCARVGIGQVLFSVRCKDANGNHAQEALKRAKFKFPGRQRLLSVANWVSQSSAEWIILSGNRRT